MNHRRVFFCFVDCKHVLMSEVLSYTYPRVLPELSANFTSVQRTQPQNGAVFRSDQSQSIIISVASTSQFLLTTQSFLSGVVSLIDAAGNVTADDTISAQGLSRIFQKLTVRVGSMVVESVDQYADLLGLYYSTTSAPRRSLLRFMEGFGDVNALKSGKRSFAHAIMSSLFVTPQAIPLPILSGGTGLTLEFHLAPLESLVTGGDAVRYEISNVNYTWTSLSPQPSYVLGLTSAIRGGRSCVIPFQRIHSFPSNGNGSKTQLIQIPVGQVSSLVSLETTMWDTVAYANRANDKYLRFGNQSILEWRLSSNEFAVPSQLNFHYDGGTNVEGMLMSLMSNSGNIYRLGEDIHLDDNFDTQSFRIGWNFQEENSAFGSGLSTIGSSSPFITLTVTSQNVIPSTTSIMTWATVDALLIFSGNDIQVTEVF